MDLFYTKKFLIEDMCFLLLYHIKDAHKEFIFTFHFECGL